ncbi:hypothetical protein [uncultured Treponema sp.]|uniref:hypothetical protein n=1 Tax=uncultured Treponema sp. TaxID=162155 RepID=UPI0025D00E91|nr:hypothetical protein [uncultured Treponema sp.]
MKKSVNGEQVFLDGEPFYKIENFDLMDDFFMTITSSSDVWNFCWAQGGISAGRKNSDFPIFPYYTCDKIQDMKGSTGSLTILKIKSEGKKGIIWQPFANLFYTGADRFNEEIGIQRNLYKSLNGDKIWFEETNLLAGISFRYGWTSSSKFGLVKLCRVENLTERKISVSILDGARNIMPSSCDASIQNSKSVLLDAYKKSEVEPVSNIALFTLSSIVTDRAEPSESLKTNVCWFTTKDPVVLSENAIELFLSGKAELLQAQKKELNGSRGQCFIIHDSELVGKSAECWEQVFDVDYDASKLVELASQITDRETAWKLLADDIKQTALALEDKIAQADGIQATGSKITDLHHRTNVMFNIMRGGIFANEGKIRLSDFIEFAETRNKKTGSEIKNLIANSNLAAKTEISRDELQNLIFAQNNPQHKRLFLEYLPLTFSRRHGDPSRPWNRFNIDLIAKDGSEKINYEGNWRDIFQNWEALLWSYPEYAINACSIFVNNMTVEGYNPYRICREGLDWEVPEEGNPWAQYGYWGDHQVIYLQKFLEFLWKFDKNQLLSLMNEKLFSTANLPYRIKSYDEIVKDPRNSISFEHEMDKALRQKEKDFGTDARSIIDEGANLQLTTLSTKLMQLVLAKILNHIPDAGIWMNTQRPEWNDANNALAGWGTSVVTMCYLERMLSFFIEMAENCEDYFLINKTVAETLEKASEIYKTVAHVSSGKTTAEERKSFTDKLGLLFETERDELYKNGFADEYAQIPAKKLAQILKTFRDSIEKSILSNKREDGLFHSYNSVAFSDSKIEIVNLKLMLEGQVAVLSGNILGKNEKKQLLEAMRSSDLFEENQYSYMLYPNSVLPNFMEKNCIKEADLGGLTDFVKKSGNKVLKKDLNGIYHFNADLRNADCLNQVLSNLSESEKASDEEKNLLHALYEKTFHHQTFTGRSGTFYAYEGLGSIYWHQVSKLLLAVQENISGAKDPLLAFYKDIKKGLGSSKTPVEYGAFPYDPYSHTPFKKGARQPGMTGQVKEEILGRWKELGLDIDDGKAVFNPTYLEKKDYTDNYDLQFTWCGTKIVYSQQLREAIRVTFKDGKTLSFDTNTLPKEESSLLFSRSGEIKEIRVKTV